MRLRILTLYLCAIVLGLGVGWILIPRDSGKGTEVAHLPVSMVPASRVADGTGKVYPSTPLAERKSTERWAHHIPLAEIPRWIQQLSRSDKHYPALFILFDRWSKVDPQAAMDAALLLPPLKSTNRYRFGPGMMGVTTEDPLYDILSKVSRNWSESDPAAAIEAVVAMSKDIGERHRLLRDLLPRYAETDPEDAVRIAFAEMNPKGRLDLWNHSTSGDSSWVSSLFVRWGKDNPQAAIDRANQIEDSSLQLSVMKGIFKGWNQQDPESAREWALSLGEQRKSHPIWSALLESIGETDPLAAMELHQAQHLMGGSTLKKLARKWAEKDVEGMIRASATTADAHLRRFLSGYGFEIMSASRTGPEMVELAMDLPRDLQQVALNMIAHRWGAQDSAAAETWGKGLEDPILRRAYLLAYYNGQHRRAPEETVASLPGIEDHSLRNKVALDLAEYWSEQNPRAAAAWIGEPREDLTQETHLEAHRRIATRWINRSPGDALAWFGSLARDGVRQAAIDGFSKAISNDEARNRFVAQIETTPVLSSKDRVTLLDLVSTKKN